MTNQEIVEIMKVKVEEIENNNLEVFNMAEQKKMGVKAPKKNQFALDLSELIFFYKLYLY